MKDIKTDNEIFFSKISHDLRGSFTSILGFSDIVNDPVENLDADEIKDFVSRIGKQSHDTFNLLVNFINWLKLENYSYGIIKEKLEIIDCLLEVKSNHTKSINSKNVKLNFEVDNTEFVVMDYEILSSILNNIFLFLLKVCCHNSEIRFNISGSDNEKLVLDITADCSSGEYSLLKNVDLRDLNDELSFPVIFALKFTEQSGGEFKFSISEKNNLQLTLALPKE